MAGAEAGGQPGEPGFETGGNGAGGLPDMSDEPSFEDVLAGMEDAMGEGASGTGTTPGTTPGSSPGAYPGSQGSPGKGSEGQSGEQTPGNYGGYPGGAGGSSGGPLTPAEQVAILDGQLEKGTGEFDDMILEEQAQQRQASRSSASEQQSGSGGGSYGGSGGGSGSGAGGGVASTGSYGGGIGGVGRSTEIPKNTPKYPPPDDIPNGNDDDVVARQLREAAMREPDPAVREKLWDEYRKYKGISK